jgi:hypothetical protein
LRSTRPVTGVSAFGGDEQKANTRQVQGVLDLVKHPLVAPKVSAIEKDPGVAHVMKVAAAGTMRERDAHDAFRSIVEKSKPKIEGLTPTEAVDLLTGILMVRTYGVERAVFGR